MDNQKELAEVFDEWEKTLAPDQKEWCFQLLSEQQSFQTG